ncbi:ELM1/GtrOC1 family putative glycosyltransferase [Acetomicrobium sp.]|uniref:ELM1/GtrOC1 family putative glycosyltransferase n=1 Tax=Acetomicrobium sp. TaxID=1872099 RepID=UPI002FCA6563
MHWLKRTGGLSFPEAVKETLRSLNAAGEEALFLSAGSGVAPLCLSLGRLFKGRCATIMTPAVLGTRPFDFAVVPEHDFPRPSKNVLVTLGAPNFVTEGKIRQEAERLKELFPPRFEKRIGLLLGGDGGNYRITPRWIEGVVKPVFEHADKNGAGLYVTTSRRTSKESEKALEGLAQKHPCVRYLCLASRDPYNPLYGIFGLATHLLATEDSVSMVSEAATAGFRVGVLFAERKKSAKRLAEGLCKHLVGWKILSARRLFGVPKFVLAIERFCERGLACFIKDFSGFERFVEGSFRANTACSFARLKGRQNGLPRPGKKGSRQSENRVA